MDIECPAGADEQCSPDRGDNLPCPLQRLTYRLPQYPVADIDPIPTSTPTAVAGVTSAYIEMMEAQGREGSRASLGETHAGKPPHEGHQNSSKRIKGQRREWTSAPETGRFLLLRDCREC
jgi:hypothetical protein